MTSSPSTSQLHDYEPQWSSVLKQYNQKKTIDKSDPYYFFALG